MKNCFSGIAYFFAIIAFLLFGLTQLYAGYIGIEYYYGPIWASAAIAVAFVFRGRIFVAPLTIGAFIAALNIWKWHWILAVLFAAPSLIYVALNLFVFACVIFKTLR